MVIQLGLFRVAITRPPLSDGLEVTIVRPVISLTLQDYKLSPKLMERLATRAEGILIFRPSRLRENYVHVIPSRVLLETEQDSQDAGISERPAGWARDYPIRYLPLEGDFEKTAEILLLVRPDYTVFDEVRKSKDFMIFADMRLLPGRHDRRRSCE